MLELCNQEFVEDSRIRIMHDTHAGAGCTIMTIRDKIVPNMVRVDIGCGMFVSMLENTRIDFRKSSASIIADLKLKGKSRDI